MPSRDVQYVGNPYLNTYNSGWPHDLYLSWEISEKIPQPPQAKVLNLERAMTELAS